MTGVQKECQNTTGVQKECQNMTHLKGVRRGSRAVHLHEVDPRHARAASVGIQLDERDMDKRYHDISNKNVIKGKLFEHEAVATC